MTQEGGCDRQGLVHAGQAHRAGARRSVHAQQRRCARSSARDLILVPVRQVFKGPRSRPGFSVTTTYQRLCSGYLAAVSKSLE